MKAGISRATAYGVLASKWHFEFKSKTVDHLAAAFGISLDDLLRDETGRGIIAGDGRAADLDPDLPAMYGPPPRYEPSGDDDVAVPPVEGGTSRGLKAGIAGLSEVTFWFKSLPRDDRVAVFAMLSRYVSGERSRK